MILLDSTMTAILGVGLIIVSVVIQAAYCLAPEGVR